MQNRTSGEVSVFYYEVEFPESFPVAFTRHLQRYQSGDSLHFHNGLEIGYCHQGSGLFFVDHHIIPFGAGDTSFIFADQPHIAQSPDEDPSYWSFLTVDVERLLCDLSVPCYQPIAEMLFSRPDMPSILKKEEHESISTLVKTIFEELEAQQPNYQLTVKGLIWSLLLMLLRLADDGGDTEHKKPASTNEMIRLSPAINHICAHYREKISIPELAKMCHVSDTHFRRLFRETLGVTPSAYLLKVRMRMAKSMLKSTDITVSEVALCVGYETLSSFNRHFLAFNNMTPTEYRKKQRTCTDEN